MKALDHDHFHDDQLTQSDKDVTQLLQAYGNGNKSVLDQLLPFVYDELRRLAAVYLARERRDHTLQPTALVHEAYLRLVNQQTVNWNNRAYFLGLAAQMMRRVLLNHAKARATTKRKADQKQSFAEVTVLVEGLDIDLLALDEALNSLTVHDKEKAQIVELKFFGGLTTKEIASILGKSTATVEREWAFARSWLFLTLTEKSHDKRNQRVTDRFESSLHRSTAGWRNNSRRSSFFRNGVCRWLTGD